MPRFEGVVFLFGTAMAAALNAGSEQMREVNVLDAPVSALRKGRKLVRIGESVKYKSHAQVFGPAA